MGVRKFTNQQARTIRTMYVAGVSHKKLAKRFFVNRNTIQKILKFVTYKSAGGPFCDGVRVCPRCNQRMAD